MVSYPDAYFSLSKSVALAQAKKVLACAPLVAYSVKTNPELTPLLHEHSLLDFQVHTLSDLSLVTDVRRAWYLLQGTDAQQMAELLRKGVRCFIADNVHDVRHVVDGATTHRVRVTLLLRMRVREQTTNTGRFFIFGMSPQTINSLVADLSSHSHIERIGVHFHRKTQNISEWNIVHEMRQALSEETLHAISLLNIGGGLPVRYKNTSDKALPSIFAQIQNAKAWLAEHDVQLMIEPGRFIAGPAVRLHTFVKAVYDNTIIINASVYNGALDSILAVPTRLLVAQECDEGTSFVIKGSTPDSMDIFRYDVCLPRAPKVGDEITFLHAGAYNFSTNFYGLSTLPTKLVD